MSLREKQGRKRHKKPGWRLLVLLLKGAVFLLTGRWLLPRRLLPNRTPLGNSSSRARSEAASRLLVRGSWSSSTPDIPGSTSLLDAGREATSTETRKRGDDVLRELQRTAPPRINNLKKSTPGTPRPARRSPRAGNSPVRIAAPDTATNSPAVGAPPSSLQSDAPSPEQRRGKRRHNSVNSPPVDREVVAAPLNFGGRASPVATADSRREARDSDSPSCHSCVLRDEAAKQIASEAKQLEALEEHVLQLLPNAERTFHRVIFTRDHSHSSAESLARAQSLWEELAELRRRLDWLRLARGHVRMRRMELEQYANNELFRQHQEREKQYMQTKRMLEGIKTERLNHLLALEQERAALLVAGIQQTPSQRPMQSASEAGVSQSDSRDRHEGKAARLYELRALLEHPRRQRRGWN